VSNCRPARCAWVVVPSLVAILATVLVAVGFTVTGATTTQTSASDFVYDLSFGLRPDALSEAVADGVMGFIPQVGGVGYGGRRSSVGEKSPHALGLVAPTSALDDLPGLSGANRTGNALKTDAQHAFPLGL
jgi:hypothetical protein